MKPIKGDMLELRYRKKVREYRFQKVGRPGTLFEIYRQDDKNMLWHKIQIIIQTEFLS